MTRNRLKYLRKEAIEDVTAQRIRQYEAKTGQPMTLPVPLEEIVEQVLGLDFDWDTIDEQPGEQILGGLDASNRKILLNEAHADLFDEKPGLLHSTIGHEAGHWDVDIDRAKLAHLRTVPVARLLASTAVPIPGPHDGRLLQGDHRAWRPGDRSGRRLSMVHLTQTARRRRAIRENAAWPFVARSHRATL